MQKLSFSQRIFVRNRRGEAGSAAEAGGGHFAGPTNKHLRNATAARKQPRNPAAKLAARKPLTGRDRETKQKKEKKKKNKVLRGAPNQGSENARFA